MRRRTQYALAGAVVGSTLLAAGSTFAVFTDAAAVSGTAGAGSLTLSLDATTVSLTADGKGVTPLRVTSTGAGPVQLSLSVTGNPTTCAALPDAVLLVTGPGQKTPVSRSLANFGTSALPLGYDPAVPDSANLKLQLGSTTAAAGTWTCTLHFELAQPGGFTDTVDVPLVVTVPKPKGPVGPKVPVGPKATAVPPGAGGRTTTVPIQPPAPQDATVPVEVTPVPAEETPVEAITPGTEESAEPTAP